MLFRNRIRRVHRNRPSSAARRFIGPRCGSPESPHWECFQRRLWHMPRILPAGIRTGRKRLESPANHPEPHVQPKTVFAKFPDWVACVAFSPDGKTLAAGSYGVAKLLDVAKQQEIAAFTEPAGFVKAVAFSPDGKTLVIGSYQSLSLWDVATRKVVHTLKGHRGYVTSLAFSHDQKTLASGSDDETVRLWDATSGESRGTIKGFVQPVLAVAWSHDGQRIAVATGDATRPTKKGAARVFDAPGRPLLTLEGHDRVVSAWPFRPTASRWRPAAPTKRSSSGSCFGQGGAQCSKGIRARSTAWRLRPTGNGCFPSAAAGPSAATS